MVDPRKYITEHAGRSAWFAYDPGSYDGPGSPMGFGTSEEEAVADLEEQVAEREAA